MWKPTLCREVWNFTNSGTWFVAGELPNRLHADFVELRWWKTAHRLFLMWTHAQRWLQRQTNLHWWLRMLGKWALIRCHLSNLLLPPQHWQRQRAPFHGPNCVPTSLRIIYTIGTHKKLTDTFRLSRMVGLGWWLGVGDKASFSKAYITYRRWYCFSFERIDWLVIENMKEHCFVFGE